MSGITRTNKFTKGDLISLQSYPFSIKIMRTQTRIWEWYTEWGGKVYVSFSGGKDSTVLADLTARLCKAHGWELVLMFVDTGLEYPEIRKFVKYFAQWLRETYCISVILDIRRPTESFDRVVQRAGFPFVSKEVSHVVYGGRLGQPSCLRKLRGEKLDNNGEKSKYNCEKWAFLLNERFEIGSNCCEIMKKQPAKKYEQETGRVMITAEMAQESQLRQTEWLENGCNAFDLKRPKSTPMAFWIEQDVLRYIKEFNIPYASVYGQIVDADPQLQFFVDLIKLKTTGCDRTGCMFCGFGIFQEKGENRFQRMKHTHPKQYAYCLTEPQIIHKKTGREMFKLQDNRMAIAFRLRRKYGDKDFDKRFKVIGGLGMKPILDRLKIPY